METKESPKLNLEGSAQARGLGGKEGGGRKADSPAGEEKAFLFKRLFEVYHPPHKVGIRFFSVCLLDCTVQHASDHTISLCWVNLVPRLLRDNSERERGRGRLAKLVSTFVSLSGPRPPPPRTWSRQAGRRPPPPRVTPGIYIAGGGGEGKGASPPPLRLPLSCSGTFYRKTLFAAGREGRGEVESTFRLSRSSSLSPAHTCSIRRIVSLARQPRNILKRTLTLESSPPPPPLFR